MKARASRFLALLGIFGLGALVLLGVFLADPQQSAVTFLLNVVAGYGIAFLLLFSWQSIVEGLLLLALTTLILLTLHFLLDPDASRLIRIFLRTLIIGSMYTPILMISLAVSFSDHD